MSGPDIQDDEGGASDPGAPEPAAPEEGLRDAFDQVNELKAYAAQYIAAKVDSLKLTARKAVVFAALGVLGLIVLTAVLVTAVVFAISGLAQALTMLLKGRAWAGNLIAGSVVLGGIALGAVIVVVRIFSKSRQATVKRHEQRLQHQREQLGGHDAGQRSAEERSQAD